MHQNVVVGEEVGIFRNGERESQTRHDIDLYLIIFERGVRIKVPGLDVVGNFAGIFILVLRENQATGENVNRAVHRRTIGAVPLIAIPVGLHIGTCIIEVYFIIVPNIARAGATKLIVVIARADDFIQGVRIFQNLGIGVITIHAQTQAEDNVAEGKFVLDVKSRIDGAVGRYREGTHTVGIRSGEKVVESPIKGFTQIVVAIIPNDALIIQFFGGKHTQAQFAGVHSIYVDILRQRDVVFGADGAVKLVVLVLGDRQLAQVECNRLAINGIGNGTNVFCTFYDPQNVVVGLLTGNVPKGLWCYHISPVGTLLVNEPDLNVVATLIRVAGHEVKVGASVEGIQIAIAETGLIVHRTNVVVEAPGTSIHIRNQTIGCHKIAECKY